MSGRRLSVAPPRPFSPAPEAPHNEVPSACRMLQRRLSRPQRPLSAAATDPKRRELPQ